LVLANQNQRAHPITRSPRHPGFAAVFPPPRPCLPSFACCSVIAISFFFPKKNPTFVPLVLFPSLFPSPALFAFGVSRQPASTTQSYPSIRYLPCIAIVFIPTHTHCHFSQFSFRCSLSPFAAAHYNAFVFLFLSRAFNSIFVRHTV